MDADTETLPSDYECLGCFYDLGGAAARTCPECGRVAGAADLAVYSTREYARTQIGGMLLLHLIVGGAICVLFAAGVALLTERVVEGADAFLACAAAVCGSVGAGAVASRFARKRERAGYFVVWLRTHFWLNASWLSAPVSGLIVVAALFEDPHSSAYRPGGLSLAVALIGLLVWLVATILCLLRWIFVFARGARRLRLRGGLVRFAFAGAAVIVLLGSMVFGISAGAECLRVADQRVHDHP